MIQYESVLNKQRNFYSTQVTKSVSYRKGLLTKLYNLVKESESDILKALYEDFRKPEFEGYATEIGLVLNEIRVQKNNLKKYSRPRRVNGNILDFLSTGKIYPEPRGQVLIIAPWNYPFQLIMAPLAGAISAGNTVIIKPSELSPATSATIYRMISNNFPEEMICCVEGGKEETEKLLKLKFDYIFFTGSEKVGRIVMEAAAKNLCPVCLELGGKSPCIIDNTIPIDLSSRRIAWGKYLNAGQTCIAPDYLIVHKEVSNAIKNGIKENIIRFYGENPQKSKDYARIINLDHFKRIKSLIDPHKIFYGGITDEKELYISPTILENISPEDNVMKEEIFGPVLPVIEFSTSDEIIQIISKFPKPLSFYIFSKDPSLRKKLLKEIEAGNGNINDTVMQFANKNLPFGGNGNSGNGSYHGRYSFDCFSHFKAVNNKTIFFDIPFRYPPYDKTKLRFIKWFLK